MNKELISPEYLRCLYEVRDGVLVHKIATHGKGGKIAPGDPAGCPFNGYLMCRISGANIFAHRIVWALEYNAFPPEGKEIDHIDGNRSNNHPDNLRLVDRSQNNFNAKKRSNNTSGYKGVSFDRSRGLWDARIRHRNKLTHLGRFPTPEAAKAAYEKAAIQRGEYHRP